MKNVLLIFCAFAVFSCSSDDNNGMAPADDTQGVDFSQYFTSDFEVLPNYANQTVPNYINRDNTGTNVITDNGAMLGRVLFYDKNLSSNNTIACASCHKQDLAFGDDDSQSIGVAGVTGRHSMRLVNARFSDEARFFWDERANTLETQTTMPIQDHIEMGFSGENGDQNFQDLITKLEALEYYPELFNRAFGSEAITETRMQNALAQFVRSIQSFDSKYDEGRAQVANDGQAFPNFTAEENLGKQLFLAPPNFDNQGMRIGGGIGCAGCHQAPEFSIDPNSLNNGIIGTADNSGTDINVTRSPTLRDVVKADGTANGQFMHIGASSNLVTVMNHYNAINLNVGQNTNLDPRLRPGGNPQQLNMTNAERSAIIAFIQTLAGTDIYTNEKWSDPFIQ